MIEDVTAAKETLSLNETMSCRTVNECLCQWGNECERTGGATDEHQAVVEESEAITQSQCGYTSAAL